MSPRGTAMIPVVESGGTAMRPGLIAPGSEPSFFGGRGGPPAVPPSDEPEADDPGNAVLEAAPPEVPADPPEVEAGGMSESVEEGVESVTAAAGTTVVEAESAGEVVDAGAVVAVVEVVDVVEAVAAS